MSALESRWSTGGDGYCTQQVDAIIIIITYCAAAASLPGNALAPIPE